MTKSVSSVFSFIRASSRVAWAPPGVGAGRERLAVGRDVHLHVVLLGEHAGEHLGAVAAGGGRDDEGERESKLLQHDVFPPFAPIDPAPRVRRKASEWMCDLGRQGGPAWRQEAAGPAPRNGSNLS